jgi:HAD superfamily hydrolase (TIGR01450 family)
LGIVTRGTIVCDLDGVVYVGGDAVPGSGAALAELARRGYRILFCTNNSSRTRAQTAEKIKATCGYDASPESVLGSAAAAASLVAPEEGRAFVLGGDGVRAELEAAGIEMTADWRSADVVVVGIDLDLTYEALAAAVLAVRSGARLIATNHDATYPSPEGLKPGAGAIVAAVEVATDTRAVCAGKPHEPMRQLVRGAASDGPIWVVGDRQDTDLAMAHAEGWRSALVLTGVSEGPDPGVPAPDLVVPDLAAFAAALEDHPR